LFAAEKALAEEAKARAEAEKALAIAEEKARVAEETLANQQSVVKSLLALGIVTEAQIADVLRIAEEK
jgi:hypothetical protein